jgi:hypothetical protein
MRRALLTVVTIAATALGSLLLGSPASQATASQAAVSFVQENHTLTTGATVSVSMVNPTAAGDLLAVYVIWDNTSAATVSDSRGDLFSAVSPAVRFARGAASAQVFYARTIAGGPDTITATFGTPTTSYGILYAHEYSGLDQTAPLDVTASASGTGSAMSSGPATTTNAHDLLFGVGVSTGGVTAGDPAYAIRSMAYANITEDRTVTATGAYTAAATQSAHSWAMQMVAFRAAGPGLSLPLVPWEGGPAYWNQWASTRPWTNPAFFPIGVWFESVGRQSDVDLDKAAGLNTYVEITSNSSAGLIRSNGMWDVTDIPLAEYGSENAGWLIDDEDDMIYGPGYDKWSGTDGWNTCVPAQDQGGRCGYTVMATKRAQRPQNGQPFYANFGKGVVFWENTTTCAPNAPAPCSPPADSEAGQFINGGYTDWVSADTYWYTDNDLCTGGQGGLLIPGQGPVDASGNHSLTAAQCHRASNYGLTVDKIRQLNAADGTLQPVWAFVEVGHPSTDNTSSTITGPQIQGAVMASLIHGARGIIYFNHSFGGWCQSQHVLRDGCGATVRPYVTAVNQQITALAPVLNTQSYQWTFNPDLDTMLKRGPDGALYIFAMQKTGTSGNYTFTLPSGINASSATVLNENRTVAISSGTFTDSFATESNYHIYRIG